SAGAHEHAARRRVGNLEAPVRPALTAGAQHVAPGVEWLDLDLGLRDSIAPSVHHLAADEHAVEQADVAEQLGSTGGLGREVALDGHEPARADAQHQGLLVSGDREMEATELVALRGADGFL